MEFERMGFDLSLLGYCIMAISFLIAGGAALVAYLGNAIKRWEQGESGAASEHFGPEVSEDTSMNMTPEKHRHALNRKKKAVKDDLSRRDMPLPVLTTTS